MINKISLISISTWETSRSSSVSSAVVATIRDKMEIVFNYKSQISSIFNVICYVFIFLFLI